MTPCKSSDCIGVTLKGGDIVITLCGGPKQYGSVDSGGGKERRVVVIGNGEYLSLTIYKATL